MDLEDIWAYDQVQTLDDNLAKAKGHVLPGGDAALHGTWTRMHMFRVRVENDNSLTVFDEDGHIARFMSVSGAAIPTWTSTTDSWPFLAGTNQKELTPSLVLAAYGDDEVPSGASKGDVYVATSTDAASVGGQQIVIPGKSELFTWSTAGGSLTLDFTRVPPQVGPPSGDDFSATFTGQSEWSETAFPYYGFDPRKMLIFSEAGAFELPGTPSQSVAYSDQPGQTFIAPLIFDFPAADSRDYVRSPDLSEQPNLPIGRRWIPIKTTKEMAQTRTVSSVAEMMTSWSSTLGLSAGVEGMFSVGADYSCHDKVEEQQKTQSRYSVSRKFTIAGTDIIHVPSLALHADFVSRLEDATDIVIANGKADWKGFVGHFGTHYLHAMTHGGLMYGQTRMSLEDDMTAHTAGFELSVKAEGSLEDGKLDSKDSYAAEWSDKTGLTVEAEDVDCYEIGGEHSDAVGILFDLRPISELLNPLLLPYNPADEWGAKAPSVWTDVRAQLDEHLATLGVNQPIDASLAADYTPRTVRVSVGRPGYNFSSSARSFAGDILMGEVSIDAPEVPNAQQKLQVGPPAKGIGAELDQIPQLPEELTFCVVAARANVEPQANVTVEMTFGSEMDLGWGASFVGTLPVAATVPESATVAVTAGPIVGVNGPDNQSTDVFKLDFPVTFTEISRAS